MNAKKTSSAPSSDAPDWMPAHKAELVPSAPTEGLALEKLKGIEDEILVECASLIQGVLKFSELDFDNPEIMPEGWVAQLGQKEAEKQHRIARYALLNPKEAPVALKMGQSTFTGITKARATEKAAPRSLSVSFVQLTPPMLDFVETEILDED